jgi:hypothetical protein
MLPSGLRRRKEGRTNSRKRRLMLILLIIPVLAAVALAHRNLQIYAPTNVLSRKVRGSAPSFSRATGVLVVALAMLLVMHRLAKEIDDGDSPWLNPVVLLLAWDAIKLGLLGIHTSARAFASACRAAIGRLGRQDARARLGPSTRGA